jgi:hypothetical protein
LDLFGSGGGAGGRGSGDVAPGDGSFRKSAREVPGGRVGGAGLRLAPGHVRPRNRPGTAWSGTGKTLSHGTEARNKDFREVVQLLGGAGEPEPRSGRACRLAAPAPSWRGAPCVSRPARPDGSLGGQAMQSVRRPRPHAEPVGGPGPRAGHVSSAAPVHPGGSALPAVLAHVRSMCQCGGPGPDGESRALSVQGPVLA